MLFLLYMSTSETKLTVIVSDHLEMTILSSFTHSHVILNPYEDMLKCLIVALTRNNMIYSHCYCAAFSSRTSGVFLQPVY